MQFHIRFVVFTGGKRRAARKSRKGKKKRARLVQFCIQVALQENGSRAAILKSRVLVWGRLILRVRS